MARLKTFMIKLIDSYETMAKRRAAERLMMMGYRKEALEIYKTL